MKEYTAIYSTEVIKGMEYAFRASDDAQAAAFANHKFNAKHIIVRNDNTRDLIYVK